MKRECESCIKRKTPYCPNSTECMATDDMPYYQNRIMLLEENKELKDKLSKIETLIINHNCDTGDIYYKYNSKFLKSELKQRILEIVCKEESDSNEKNDSI